MLSAGCGFLKVKHEGFKENSELGYLLLADNRDDSKRGLVFDPSIDGPQALL